MKKNTAVKIIFPIWDNDGDLVSGATGLDSEYSLNGGSFVDCTNEATEIGSSGIYYLELVAGETNGDAVCIQVKTTTVDAKTTVLTFYPAAQTLDEMDTVIDSIKTDTGNVLTDTGNILIDTGTTLNDMLLICRRALINKMVVNVATSQLILYADDGVTPLYTWALTDKDGNPIVAGAGTPTTRGAP